MIFKLNIILKTRIHFGRNEKQQHTLLQWHTKLKLELIG